jgi:hypothetical protein
MTMNHEADRAAREQEATEAVIRMRESRPRTARSTILNTALCLDTLAERLDGWAKESRDGGWSTHQVEPNKYAAEACRAQAAALRRIVQ